MFMCILCTVVGCGDVTAPEGAWVQRDGDVTTLGCHSGKHTWTLRCENSLWEGAVGSCGKVDKPGIGVDALAICSK